VSIVADTINWTIGWMINYRVIATVAMTNNMRRARIYFFVGMINKDDEI